MKGAGMKFWLMKTEPDVFSYSDLCAAPNSTEPWDGIRNYQARNFLRDEFAKGDFAFIYHSRIKEPSIVGIAEVVTSAYPDHTALDPKSKYFDPKSAEKGQSRWVMVDVKAVEKLKNPVTLSQLRDNPNLSAMKVIQRGQRLSIQPVTKKEWNTVCRLGGIKRTF